MDLTSPTFVDIMGLLQASASLTTIGPVSEKEVTKSRSAAFIKIQTSCFVYPFNSTSSISKSRLSKADFAKAAFFIGLSNLDENNT